MRNALAARVVVEQAKGFLRESLGVSVEDGFDLLRRYARYHNDHLTGVSRRLITQPDCRPTILAAMTTMKVPRRRRSGPMSLQARSRRARATDSSTSRSARTASLMFWA